MTAHVFARQLLAGPDLTIMVYRDSADERIEDNLVTHPVVTEEEGEDTRTGEERRLLVIGYSIHE